MKKKSQLLSGVFFSLTLFSILLSSCKKDDSPNKVSDAEIQNAMDVVANHQVAMHPFDGIYAETLSQFDDLADAIGRLQGGRVYGIAGGGTCYTTTVTPKGLLTWPKTVERTYSDCLGADGIMRNGKVISVFSDLLLTKGATATTTYEDYSVDSFNISGTVKLTNMFTDAPDATYAIKVEFEDAKATHMRTGFWTKINGSLTYQLVKQNPDDFNPLSPFTTSGTLNGDNSLGFKWTAETTKPVLRDFDCLWPMSGVITLYWDDNNEQVSIDYGDGNCDNKAEISYNGFKKTISL